MLSYFTFNTSFELICLAFAILCLWRTHELVWKSLIFYLFIICLAEFTGVYLKRHYQSNQWIYNVLLVFQIGFTSIMFKHLFDKYSIGKPAVFLGWLLLLSLYIIDLLTHGFFKFNMLTYNTMSVVFILYSLFYFYLLLNDEAYIDLKYSAKFWWVTGVLFFYFGSTAVNLFRGKTAIMLSGHSLSYYIYIVLNMILYGCWSYSFICKKWLTKISEA